MNLIISHDPDENDPSILGAREEPDSYTPGPGEFVAPSGTGKSELYRKVLDYSTDPPSIIDDPDHDPRSPVEVVQDRLDSLENDVPVARKRVSEADKQAFRDARTANDLQGQLDVLFEVLTGEVP